MKILAARDLFLSNYEVEQQLQELKKRYNWTFTLDDDKKTRDRHRKRFTAGGINLEVVTRDTLAYFHKTPTNNYQDFDQFKLLMEYLNTLDLVKAEKLQIVNQLPRQLVQLYTVVDEYGERFGEDQAQEICDKINEIVPEPETEAVEEEEAEEDEEAEGEAMEVDVVEAEEDSDEVVVVKEETA